MKTKLKLLLILLTGLCMTSFVAFAGPGPAGKPPALQTVASVDLNRYQGLWYQIAYIPTWFQKGCEIDVTAKYTLRDDGQVTVENECTKENGTRKSIKGTAYSVAPESNAKLKVKFFWFAPAGDYWVIDLGQDYEYAVVGTPNRKYLWVLSRSPQMATDRYEEILKKVEAQHYHLGRIKVTAPLTENGTP